MQIYLRAALKYGFAGTEQMNNVIIEKRRDYIYFWSVPGILLYK